MSLKGFTIQLNNRPPSRPLTGLLGVTVGINAVVTFKITNKAGRGVAGASIQLPDGRVFNGDAQGNVLLPAINNGDVLIIRKDLIRRDYTWLTGQTQVTFNIQAPTPNNW